MQQVRSEQSRWEYTCWRGERIDDVRDPFFIKVEVVRARNDVGVFVRVRQHHGTTRLVFAESQQVLLGIVVLQDQQRRLHIGVPLARLAIARRSMRLEDLESTHHREALDRQLEAAVLQKVVGRIEVQVHDGLEIGVGHGQQLLGSCLECLGPLAPHVE